MFFYFFYLSIQQQLPMLFYKNNEYDHWLSKYKLALNSFHHKRSKHSSKYATMSIMLSPHTNENMESSNIKMNWKQGGASSVTLISGRLNGPFTNQIYTFKPSYSAVNDVHHCQARLHSAVVFITM